jgi:hypothetical protein
MPSRVVIQTNLQSAMEQLRQAGVNVEAVKSQVVEAAGEVLLEKAMEYAPSPTSTMYPTSSTGFLRDSHELVTSDNEAIVQPTAPYAVYVHEGHFTAVKFVKGKATPKAGFVAPRPWLYYAAMDSREDIGNLARDVVQSALEQATGAAPEA